MNHKPTITPRRRPAAVSNRVVALMIHTSRYSCFGLSRLSADTGIAKSAISRLLRGDPQPSYMVLFKVAEALSREIGFPIDLRELAVVDGHDYPTKYPCDLFGCRCIPPWGYDENGDRKPAYKDMASGTWTFTASPFDLES